MGKKLEAPGGLEEALRQCRERFRTLSELSSQWYWEQDARYRFTVISSGMAGAAGQGIGVQLGATRWSQPALNMTEADWGAHRRVLDARQPFRELELCRPGPQGERVWISVSGKPAFDAGGRFTGYCGVARDITARKLGEEALRESEERFRSLAALSSDIFWEQDAQYRFVSFQGMGGDKAAVGRFLGRRLWDQPYLNMSPDDWAAHIALLDARRPFRDLELCRADETGQRIWVSVSGEPVFDAGGGFRGYRGIGRHITARKLDEERIQYLANHDPLTGLPNRSMFGAVLKLTLSNARRYGRSFAVMFVDLDGFKHVNDTLGHEAGDRLLQAMAERLRQAVRASDVVARLGGDEFMLLVQEVLEPRQAETVARKVLDTLAQPVGVGARSCAVSGSVGIALYPSEGQDEQALMKNADSAMYLAKEAGRNTYRFYSQVTAGRAAAGEAG